MLTHPHADEGMYSRLWSTASRWSADRDLLVLLTHPGSLPPVPSGGRLLNVEGWLTSAIAVAGTLLGATVTYIFQRANAGRAERFARDERLRQERIATYSGFAGAIAELRRAVISLWFVLQRSDPGDPERNAAYTESDRLGAAAHHARFRVQLVAEDSNLVALADAAFEPIDAIRDAADRAELVEHEGRCQEILKAFITAAGAQVR